MSASTSVPADTPKRGAIGGYRQDGRARRPRPHRSYGHGARLFRPQRFWQVDHDPCAAQFDSRRRRQCERARRQSLARCSRAAPTNRVRARRHESLAESHRRPGHRHHRLAARRPRRRSHRALRRALQPRFFEEGPQLIEGQPSEGRAGCGPRLTRRAARLRRTSGLDPLMERCFRTASKRSRQRGVRCCSRATSSPRCSGSATRSQSFARGRPSRFLWRRSRPTSKPELCWSPVLRCSPSLPWASTSRLMMRSSGRMQFRAGHGWATPCLTRRGRRQTSLR